ncbi:MAG TPA: hypothetical protein VHK28_07565 [Candidatus Limnocylindria bacterium]|nr:hypothetical protein [Candidatus Limnocylindria bacterium]
MSRYLRGGLVATAAAALLTTALLTGAFAAPPDDLAAARAATARFNSLKQAEKAGYALPPEGPLSQCIESLDPVNEPGAMGFHLINGALLDGVVDPTKPEALVYAPDKNGKLRLVALEYVVFKSDWQGEHDPMLFGEMFMSTDAPNRYEIPAFYALHAWVWEDNPAGTFAGFNPNVSC